ncbi:cytochrome P450 [Hymenopellis radicata]|nr:cytochrome P450 [Hymenopellis radicata]
MAKLQQTDGIHDFMELSKTVPEFLSLTVSVTLTVILAMLKNRELQMRAHKELDAIVGRDRIPTFEDQKNLPFINTVFMAAMRWRLVLPLVVVHVCLSDDVSEGCFIPGEYRCDSAGQCMGHETVYCNAEVFNPDRFMGPIPEPEIGQVTRSTVIEFGIFPVLVRVDCLSITDGIFLTLS